jgi:hypothetical protein
VALAGSGQGSVSGLGISCPGTCSASYGSTTVVLLTASPAPGSVFTGWGGSCAGSSSCVVTMGTDQAVTATFDKAAGKGTTAPAGLASLSGLGETNAVFVVASASTPLTGVSARHHPKGTTFHFVLDRPATVSIAIRSLVSGRLLHGHCRPGTPKLRHRRRCTRSVVVATLSRAGHVGSNTVGFSGRIAGRPLRPGRYQAVFSATTAAGTSAPQSLGFTVVAR